MNIREELSKQIGDLVITTIEQRATIDALAANLAEARKETSSRTADGPPSDEDAPKKDLSGS